MLSVSKLKIMIVRHVARTVAIFEMFQDGDKVIIGLSGGSDSLVLVDVLYKLNLRCQFNVTFYAAYVSPGFFELSSNSKNKLENFCSNRGMSFTVLEAEKIGKNVHMKRTHLSPCFICSRTRRKALFEYANSMNAKKIALGHHREDLLDTFFLNLIYSRKISAIVPVQEFFDGLFYVVRPMILVQEEYIKRLANERNFPIIPKDCPYAGDSKREVVREIVEFIETKHPGAKKDIIRAMFYPNPDYLWGAYKGFVDKLLK